MLRRLWRCTTIFWDSKLEILDGVVCTSHSAKKTHPGKRMNQTTFTLRVKMGFFKLDMVTDLE